MATLWATACAPPSPEGAPPATGPATLELHATGTEALLQAVSVVDGETVWASGREGTWVRTNDGGESWRRGVVPDADSLEFRDVEALDARTAWLLAAGPGERSRIYHTEDGGESWSLQWLNPEPAGFWDCMDFWDERRGLVYGDAVEGGLRVLRTEDGGLEWRLVPGEALPAALPGEGGFAASGTCVVTGPRGRAWIAAGNADAARVLRTDDFGRSWQASVAPVVTGEGAGLTSISMFDERVGTAFGGAIAVTDRRTDNVARTEDGGRSWALLPPMAMRGPVYGGVHVPGTDGTALVAVGPGGVDVSVDGGRSWRQLDTRAWWGLDSRGPRDTWIAGPDGRVARVRFPAR